VKVEEQSPVIAPPVLDVALPLPDGVVALPLSGAVPAVHPWVQRVIPKIALANAAIVAEFLALEGIGAIHNTVERVRKSLNLRLHIAGVILTMVDRRMTLSQQVEADVRNHFGELVFGTTIPRNVRIAEAPSHGLPVLIYDNACAGAQAYILLASEFIRRRRNATVEAPHEPAS